MRLQSVFKVAAAVAVSAALAGCNEERLQNLVPKGELRVVHASPDAPPVNVLLNSAPSILNLDYAENSGYTKLSAGKYNIAVQGIIPGGNATVINVNNFEVRRDSRNTVVAVNNVAAIEPLVVNETAAKPNSGQVGIVVTHAAPVAGEVDVFLTAPGASISGLSPAFSFDFKESVDAGALTAGTVEIQVAIGGAVVYNSGAVNLGAFAGKKLLLLAINSENQVESAASPIKLLAVTDTDELQLLDADTQAGAKVVHASPDATLAAGGPVEVFATSSVLGPDPVELIGAFGYTSIVPAADNYVAVPAGSYVFDVAPNTNTIGDSVYTSPSISLSAGVEYTVIAAGRVLGTPAFGLLATGDSNRAIATQGSIKVTHAAPAAGSVDVYVTPAGQYSAANVAAGLAGAPLLNDFDFGEITDYVPVAPGAYDIRVVAGGVVAINVEGFAVAGGDVFNVIARGPSEPSGAPANFGVILLRN